MMMIIVAVVVVNCLFNCFLSFVYIRLLEKAETVAGAVEVEKEDDENEAKK